MRNGKTTLLIGVLVALVVGGIGSHDDSDFVPDMERYFKPGAELVIMNRAEFEELWQKASGVMRVVTISEAH